MNVRSAVLALALAAVAACNTVPKPPKVPETVTVTVTEFITVPPELYQPIPVYLRADGSVRQFVRSDNANVPALQLANCRFLLIAKLMDKKPVDPKSCVVKP